MNAIEPGFSSYVSLQASEIKRNFADATNCKVWKNWKRKHCNANFKN